MACCACESARRSDEEESISSRVLAAPIRNPFLRPRDEISPRSFGSKLVAAAGGSRHAFSTTAPFAPSPKHSWARAADPTRQTAEAAGSAPGRGVGGAVLSSAPNPNFARYKDLSPREEFAISWAAFVLLLSMGHNGPPSFTECTGWMAVVPGLAEPSLYGQECCLLRSQLAAFVWELVCEEAGEGFVRGLQDPACGGVPSSWRAGEPWPVTPGTRPNCAAIPRLRPGF